MKNYIFIIFFIFIFNTCFPQDNWEISSGGSNFSHNDVSFVNSNLGYASGLSNSVMRLVRTTNKGLNWELIISIDGDYIYCKNSSIYFKSESQGFISYNDRIIKYNNGDTSTVFIFPGISRWHRLKFVNDNVGYAIYSQFPSQILGYQSLLSIYKTTNGGNNVGF